MVTSLFYLPQTGLKSKEGVYDRQKTKEITQRKDIKQIRLAEAVGISPSRLSNYLSDKREHDLEMLAKMAQFLGWM